MTRLERQVLDAIDVEGMLSLLCRLIAVPSLGGDETDAQRTVAEQMERCVYGRGSVDMKGGLCCALFAAKALRNAEISGVTYGSDMRHLVNEGHIPSVLSGPGDVRLAHQTDEFVPIDDLILAVRALALMAMRYCGVIPNATKKG